MNMLLIPFLILTLVSILLVRSHLIKTYQIAYYQQRLRNNGLSDTVKDAGLFSIIFGD